MVNDNPGLRSPFRPGAGSGYHFSFKIWLSFFGSNVPNESTSGLRWLGMTDVPGDHSSWIGTGISSWGYTAAIPTCYPLATQEGVCALPRAQRSWLWCRLVMPCYWHDWFNADYIASRMAFVVDILWLCVSYTWNTQLVFCLCSSLFAMLQGSSIHTISLHLQTSMRWRKFHNRKPIGEVGCCESWMAERTHWWIERWLERRAIYLSFYLSI